MYIIKKNLLENLLFVLVLSAITTTSFLCAQTNDTAKTPVSQTYIDRAKAKTEIMAKELNLTPAQKELVANAIARRDFENSVKMRGLTTQEEKTVVYRSSYLEFIENLKAKGLPGTLITKISLWENKNIKRI